MTIAELGRHSGVGVETVRYYQRLGLLAVPPQLHHGHRRYGQQSLAELAFVRHCKHLGFSLKQIAELVRLRHKHRTSCGELHERLAELSVQLAAKQRELEMKQRTIQALLESCDGGPIDSCTASAELAAPDRRPQNLS
jgi:MerR family mercuric resistance operon transcriptional regulator